MIEGLILLAELVALGLLLRTVQRRDTPGGRPPGNLFAYRDPGRPDNGATARRPMRKPPDA